MENIDCAKGENHKNVGVVVEYRKGNTNLLGTRMWLLLHTCRRFLKMICSFYMYIQPQMLIVIQFL